MEDLAVIEGASAPSMEELHAAFLRISHKTEQYDFVHPRRVLRSAAAAHIEDIDKSQVPAVEGNVHSFVSLSALDGPGLRWVMFVQGCKFRCKFCSNPDSWQLGAGKRLTSKDVAKDIARALPYIRNGDGGVTVSGGEPMLQPEFVGAVFRECRLMGVPTAIDTTGMGTRGMWRGILPHTDLVMLCVKAPKPWVYSDLTGGFTQENMLRCASVCEQMGIPMWIRYVLIPGYTDSTYDIDWLTQFCADHARSIQRVDVLPYHTLGIHKWQELGLTYPLEGQKSPSNEEVLSFLRFLRSRIGPDTLGVEVSATGVE